MSDVDALEQTTTGQVFPFYLLNSPCSRWGVHTHADNKRHPC